MSLKNKVSKQEIISYLAEMIGDLLDTKITDYNEPFINLGLVSVDIPLFLKKVSKQFGIDIEVASIFQYTDINKYSDYIYNKMNNEEEYSGETDNTDKDPEGSGTNEDIAIVGISCRFPGGANSPEEFWDVLMNGVSGICDMPEDRWDADKYYSPDRAEAGKMYTKRGGFLNIPVDRFDPQFFNISPKEARAMDPQQRLLLELIWEAFENAGINIARHFGSNTGVYLGMTGEEYSFAHYRSGDLNRIDAYSLTGTTASTACGRISYTFGFEGPSFCVDTACSSSLTALHVACKALKYGEVDAALVGAVNLMLSPALHVCFSKIEAMAEDGHSKSFDASANGYGRGEGGGVLLLKRLSDAKKDNDNILGIVKGTALNQDGRSNGLTAPNGLAQEKVIAKALKDAGLNYPDVDYMEMHGTGTKLGDPIEVKAVVNTYGKARAMENPLWIGSVKSNIGHLEAAAGVASIIKVLLAFKNDMIPGNLNFKEPNPFIPWEKSPVCVVAENKAWKGGDKLRRVGVNGFGFGGSNAHIILEEPPEKKPVEIKDADPVCTFKVSAKSEKALLDNIRSNLDFICGNPHRNIRDVTRTNNMAKADLNHRFTVYGKTGEELAERMKAYLDNGNKEGITVKQNDSIDLQQETKLVFLFTGQGSQYLNMGKELYDNHSGFKKAFDICDKLFEQYISKSIAEIIYSGEYSSEDIERTSIAQPLIFAIEYSLLKFWESIGVVPHIVLGHSIGEYAAAVAAGIMSLEDGARLVSLRGQLMDSAPGEGAMSAIAANEATVASLINGYEDRLTIALHNAENSIVISGEKEAVEEVSKKAEGRQIKVNRLRVSHAFHSHLMTPILEDFMTAVKDVEFKKSGIQYVSATLARVLDKEEILGADYWTDHIKDKVDFYHALSLLKDEKNTIFLEIGANRTLCALGKLILSGDKMLLGSLNMKKNPWEQIIHSVGELYCHGVKINWEKLAAGFDTEYNRVALPTYVFDRKSYWTELVFSHENSLPANAGTDYHPVIGQRISTPFLKDCMIYQAVYTAESPYFMKEHIIFDTSIAPAAAYTSILLSIAKSYQHPLSCTISNMELLAPLIGVQDEARVVQFLIEDTNSDQMKFELVSTEKTSQNENWVKHFTGNIEISKVRENGVLKRDIPSSTGIPDTQRVCPFTIAELTSMYPEEPSSFNIYNIMRKFGFALGEGFTRITKVWKGEGEGVCYLEPKTDIPGIKDYLVYPGLIDSIFQSVFAVSELSRKMDAESEKYSLNTLIPMSIGKIKYYYRDAKSYWCHVKVYDSQQSGVVGDITAYNEKGELVFEVEKIVAKLTDRDSLLKALNSSGSHMLYNVEWVEKSRNDKNIKSNENEKIVVVGSQQDIVNNFHEQFNSSGVSTIRVILGNEYAEYENDGYSVCSANKGDFEKVLVSIADKYRKEKFKLIYLSTSDEACRKDITLEGLMAREEKECSGLLYLVQSITKLNYVQKMAVKVITNNVHSLDGADISIVQSTLWGFSEVIRLEHTQLWDGIIDTDYSMLTNNTDVIVKEIRNSEDKQVVLGGNNKRYVSRLVRGAKSLNSKNDLNIAIDEKAAYIITGGTGAIGQVYAEYLIQKGAKNIVLLCRSEAKGQLLEVIKAWNEKGANVEVERVDVSNEADVKALVQKLKQRYSRIKGLVHAAGIIEDRMIKDQTWGSFENLFKTKVWGTFNLHNALKEESLDFFILMSSITSVVGNMGQANYAAANYFMNIFARYRKILGMPAMSICWGPWAEAGMAVRSDDTINNIGIKGLYSMSKELGKKMLDRVFDKDLASIVIVDANWELFSEKTGVDEVTEFLSNFIAKDKASAQSTANANKEDVLARLRALKSSERSEYLLSRLHKIAAKIMGFSDLNSLSADSSFTEQGVDSLMIFSLRNELKSLLNVQVDISAFFNYPSIRKLTDYLISDVLGLEDSAREEAAASVDRGDGSVDDVLSEINLLIN